MATTPLWQEQQLLSWLWQRRLCNDSNNAITTRATTPAWQQAMRARTLTWQWQRCLHIKDAMLPSQQRQRCLCIDNSDNAIVTRVTMPAWCTMNNSCVLFFLAGSAFWAKLLCPNLPNRERKVYTKAIVLIPAWCQTLMYAIGLVGWRRPCWKSLKSEVELSAIL